MRHPALLILLALATCATARAQGDSVYFRDVLYLGREYVNDHAIVESGGQWHLIYTRGDMSIRPWMSPGNEVSLGHAVSADLLSWTTRPPALAIGAKGAPDGEHVYAPAIARDGERWVMLYTGNERGFFSGERILGATSSDLETWTKGTIRGPLPDTSWAQYYPPGYDSGSGGPVSCRDPYLLRAHDGTWICYYVARLRDTAALPARACVAAATSSDLVTWVDRGPVLVRPVTGDDINPYTHPESPCVVEHGGRYHLFWKGGSGTRHIASDDPFDFSRGKERLVATSHASKVFEWRGEWFITSCSRMVNDVLHLQSDRTRGLYIAGLVWQDDVPRVTELPSTVGIEPEREVAPRAARIGSDGRIEGESVLVVDLLGRRVASTEALDAGVYLVRVDGWSGVVVVGRSVHRP